MRQIQNNPNPVTPITMKTSDHSVSNMSQHIHRAAISGVQGSAAALPHLNKIQAAFGHHDLSGVRAFMGSSAQKANQSIGARAYAFGSNIAFNSTAPDLHTAAHEAAHIIQQRAGVHLSGGVGSVGDKYEHQADAVADLVIKGRSAEGLLDVNSSGSLRTNRTVTTGGAGVQMLQVGMVPETPGNFRKYTNLTSAGAYGAVAAKGAFVIGPINANNIANAAGGAPVLPAGNYPKSDASQKALLTRQLASDLSPEVDHIIPKADWGSNDLENARVISLAENHLPAAAPGAPGRPLPANRRMKTYQALQISPDGMGAPGWIPNMAAAKNPGDQLTLPDVKALVRYVNGAAGVPATYAALTHAQIGAIVGAAPGKANNVEVK